mgnify:CR=1 FL=1
MAAKRARTKPTPDATKRLASWASKKLTQEQATCEHNHLCLMSKREMFCKLCKVPMEKWRGDYRPKVKGATDYEEDD